MPVPLKPPFVLYATLLLLATGAQADIFHVATRGNDANPGTRALPFRTIQHAADLAQPGDTIIVHTGVYRERVNPPRGGESDRKRITYQAAPGETVEIKGSEIVKSWTKAKGDVWQVTLPNSFFGRFNPYADVIHGDWFDPKGRKHHTGAVYLDGDWLVEAASLEEVVLPADAKPEAKKNSKLVSNLWFAQVDATNTILSAQFPSVNPNEHLVEINARQTVFYPDQPGRNFITVRGFTMSHAATPWAPPTAEQIGLLGTHWSKGWIIESNNISYSICCGISLGKYGDQFDNTSADSAEGYVKTIERAHAHNIAWAKENIGHHIVRNNTVSHCEQAGIVGSLGCSFSTVTGNTIHDIHVRRLFTGVEMAGIKFHGAIDTEISRNHVYQTCRGLWLDWMTQGTRVSQNLFHDNSQDVYVEVNHGPFVVDNNLFLSSVSLMDFSEGGAYAHNLMTGKIISRPEPQRETPFHPAHSTKIAGLLSIKGGDNRFYNNLFIGDGKLSGVVTNAPKPAAGKPQSDIGYGLWVYDNRELPLQTGGNVYLNGARPYTNELSSVMQPVIDPKVGIVKEGGHYYLHFDFGSALEQANPIPVTSTLLSKAKIAGLPYENVDGSPLAIDRDYFGKARSKSMPTPGPFERLGNGAQTILVW
ncbi:MAG: right-handed parallel beta-helix repeat-containing protein [Verrucomicrobiota bacterium]